MKLELIKSFVASHLDMTRRVWDSIDHITDEQFLEDFAYSRGSIRNLMVHPWHGSSLHGTATPLQV